MASAKKDVPAVQIKKAGAVPPPAAPKGPDKVEGKAVKDLVQVEYKGENTHILHHVHAVVPGLNWVSQAVLDEALKHPHNQHLVKSGKLLVLAPPPKKGKASAPVTEDLPPKSPEEIEAAAKAEAEAKAAAEAQAKAEAEKK